MRLIDADAYEKSLHVFYGDDGLQEINPDEVFIKLHEAQTVDAVPVVRCKDCKHYGWADNRAFGFPVKRCEWTGFEDVDDEDFCSRGERRQE